MNMPTIHHNPGAFAALDARYCEYETAAIAVLPLPYNGTATWIKGAQRGPAALLEASGNLELYDIETDSEVYRKGIVTLEPVECPKAPAAMVEAVYGACRKVIRDHKFPVGIGGEHSVSIGLVQAIVEQYPCVSVLQLDAHADLRDSYGDSRYNHACVMARIREMCPIVQVGIRSMDISEKPVLDPDRVLFANRRSSHPDPVDWLHSRLTENVYITIDLDVFDPGIMPSTGTPEPGGLGWNDVIHLLQGIVHCKNIVGLDVVELCPNPANKAPDFLAAKLIYRILSMIYAKENR
jgi:agmatinase